MAVEQHGGARNLMYITIWLCIMVIFDGTTMTSLFIYGSAWTLWLHQSKEDGFPLLSLRLLSRGWTEPFFVVKVSMGQNKTNSQLRFYGGLMDFTQFWQKKRNLEPNLPQSTVRLPIQTSKVWGSSIYQPPPPLLDTHLVPQENIKHFCFFSF